MSDSVQFLSDRNVLRITFLSGQRKVKVAQLCLTLCDPMDLVHGILQARILKPFLSPGDLPNPGIKPRSPTLQAGSLPVEPQGKPKNTGVGSLSLLQRIFLTQELNPFEPWNPGLPHRRQILYHLSHQGSHVVCICTLLLSRFNHVRLCVTR